MNLSGESVIKFVNYYKINIEDILVIHDDLDIDLGRIKLKENGSSGGHNGIKSIIENLNTEEFAHFKVGIRNNKEISTKDYVLGKFNKKELDTLNKIFEFSSNIIDDFLDLNIERLMSKYNGEDYEIK
jgi:PTH1 family peptidyl-tRNA hydrolase